MRRATVLYKNEHAGTLTQLDDGSFEFTYLDTWVLNPAKPAISLTLPKTREPYRSSDLFPFFFNMLPEGSNKQTVCYHLRIDQDDDFGILMATSKTDTIGAVRIVKEIEA
jgi:serine/threonine-protein kinase HipA